MADSSYTEAINKALTSAKSMLGKNEVPDREEIQSYLHDGGQDLDPHKLAWCAAFVSASLQKAGLPVPTQVIKDSAVSPGAYAGNYRTYGNAVEPKGIQAGDILVANDGSHVGFAEGPIRQGRNGPEVQLIAGNERDASGQYAPGAYTNPTTGAVANRAQVGRVGERWVPLSQYSARRYEVAPSGTTITSAPVPTSGAPAGALAAPAAATVPTLSSTDRDYVIRTLAGEEGNPEGWGAVANVVKNRLSTGKWGPTAKDVVLSPGQFSMWNKATGYAGGAGANDLGQKLQPDSARYKQIGSIVDEVWGGKSPDPTKGALNYYAPKGMKGGKPPSWAAEMKSPITIGAQVYGTADSTSPKGPARPVTPTPGAAPAVASAAEDTPWWQKAYGAIVDKPKDAQGNPIPGAQSPYEKFAETMAKGPERMKALEEAQAPQSVQNYAGTAPAARNVSPGLANIGQTYGQTLNSYSQPLTWNNAPPRAPQMAAGGFQPAPGSQAPGMSLNSFPVGPGGFGYGIDPNLGYGFG